MTRNGHEHNEAFCLMTYASDDGTVEEVIWNSRDGVTPFVISTKDGTMQMTHVNWSRDRYAPDHEPKPGDRVFVDLTPDRARESARRNAERYWNDPRMPASEEGRWATVDELADLLFREYTRHPRSPDLITVE